MSQLLWKKYKNVAMGISDKFPVLYSRLSLGKAIQASQVICYFHFFFASISSLSFDIRKPLVCHTQEENVSSVHYWSPIVSSTKSLPLWKSISGIYSLLLIQILTDINGTWVHTLHRETKHTIDVQD